MFLVYVVEISRLRKNSEIIFTSKNFPTHDISLQVKSLLNIHLKEFIRHKNKQCQQEFTKQTLIVLGGAADEETRKTVSIVNFTIFHEEVF